MSRRPLVAANWKMNLLRDEARRLCSDLAAELRDPPADIVIFPSATLIDVVITALGELPVAVGGQDVHSEAAGAFTGDLAAAQLRDAGCTWALCGHSERRRDHGETDQLVGLKAARARSIGLEPLVCVGETREDRESGRTFEVLVRQLDGLFGALDSGFTLAYEPVWAIGTGLSATPALAAETHEFLRSELDRRLGVAHAASIRILYGGSVTPENCVALSAAPAIDGFLVGGASLDSRKFLTIIAGSAQRQL